MLLSYNELVEVVAAGYIDGVHPDAINATSIDLHLGRDILVECHQKGRVVDLGARESIAWSLRAMGQGGSHLLHPSEFILAHTQEWFNMPDDLSAEFSLKSSIARNGLEHLLAGWIDPGFHGSVLTLELKNTTQSHVLKLCEGMPIGQVKFFRHTQVPADKSYRARGRYNGDGSVRGIRQ